MHKSIIIYHYFSTQQCKNVKFIIISHLTELFGYYFIYVRATVFQQPRTIVNIRLVVQHPCCYYYYYYYLKKIGSARLRDSDVHPISP